MSSSQSQLLEGVVLLGRHHQQQQKQQETPQQAIRLIQSQDHHPQVYLHLPWLLLLHRLERAGRQLLPNNPIHDNIHCTHPQVSGYILYNDLRERNLPGPREPGGTYLPKEHVIAIASVTDVVSGIKRATACPHVILKGVRMKGVVSFAHGDISIGQNQGGE